MNGESCTYCTNASYVQIQIFIIYVPLPAQNTFKNIDYVTFNDSAQH